MLDVVMDLNCISSQLFFTLIWTFVCIIEFIEFSIIFAIILWFRGVYMWVKCWTDEHGLCWSEDMLQRYLNCFCFQSCLNIFRWCLEKWHDINHRTNTVKFMYQHYTFMLWKQILNFRFFNKCMFFLRET